MRCTKCGTLAKPTLVIGNNGDADIPVWECTNMVCVPRSNFMNYDALQAAKEYGARDSRFIYKDKSYLEVLDMALVDPPL